MLGQLLSVQMNDKISGLQPETFFFFLSLLNFEHISRIYPLQTFAKKPVMSQTEKKGNLGTDLSDVTVTKSLAI